MPRRVRQNAVALISLPPSPSPSVKWAYDSVHGVVVGIGNYWSFIIQTGGQAKNDAVSLLEGLLPGEGRKVTGTGQGLARNVSCTLLPELTEELTWVLGI